MSLLNTILDIVFPVNCISCGQSGMDLCINCLTSTREAERESEKWIFPLYDYRDIKIKKAVWLLKYSGKKRIANVFALVLYDRMLEELGDLSRLENFKNPILIPIPLSSKRRRERGFNQTELICNKLAKIDKLNNGGNFKLEKNILIKIKDTEHQARIKNRRERLESIVNSFSIKNVPLLKDRNIILIDDVTTTGATLREARKVLKDYGAKKIIAFTIAH